MKRLGRGFSLIELLITLAIVGVLLALGASSFSAWIMNMRIRTAAEAIQNGLQLARGEAVRRNSSISFSLTTSVDGACILSTTSSNWVVSFDNPSNACDSLPVDDTFLITDAVNNPAPRILQRRAAAEGSNNVVVAAGQATVIFNGLGRVTNAAASPVVINVQPPAAVGNCASLRCLRVTVTLGGQIRMCDPAYPVNGTDPQRCPVGG